MAGVAAAEIKSPVRDERNSWWPYASSGRAQAPAVPAGLVRLAKPEPSHQWLGYFQKTERDAAWRWLRAGSSKKARGDAKLFHLFDDEHFDGHIGGNKFEAKLVTQCIACCLLSGF